MWTEILVAIAGAVVGQVVNYIVQKWRQKNRDMNNWYKETLSLVSHGHGICLSARTRSNLNYGDISTESREISQRLKKKTDPHPKKADEVTVDQLQSLSEMFRKMSAVAEATEDQSTMESINEIFEMGQIERSGNEDLDMGELVNTSTDYSPTMDKMFKKSDIDPRQFGSQFGENFSDAESITMLIDEMGPVFGNQQEEVEKIIESEMVSEEWDESLSVGMRIHLQIVSSLCEETINHISEVSNMETAT